MLRTVLDRPDVSSRKFIKHTPFELFVCELGSHARPWPDEAAEQETERGDDEQRADGGDLRSRDENAHIRRLGRQLRGSMGARRIRSSSASCTSARGRFLPS